ncbi:hypothetical protein [Streptomyces sp. NBC_00090]|uniref:hypothetical protein n=1 Tax=Streptomyces sp. NBC_00090 TaxID=2903619 RepID=UPI003864F921
MRKRATVSWAAHPHIRARASAAANFFLRGEDGARGEWRLLAACHNLRKIFRHTGTTGLTALAGWPAGPPGPVAALPGRTAGGQDLDHSLTGVSSATATDPIDHGQLTAYPLLGHAPSSRRARTSQPGESSRPEHRTRVKGLYQRRKSRIKAWAEHREAWSADKGHIPSSPGARMVLIAVLGVALLVSGLAGRSVLSTSLLFLLAGALVSDGFLGPIHIAPNGPVVVATADAEARSLAEHEQGTDRPTPVVQEELIKRQLSQVHDR